MEIQLDDISFGEVYHSEIVKDTITIVNDDSLILHVFVYKVPKYLNFQIESNQIPPHSSSKIVCTFYPDQVDKYGFLYNKVTTLLFNNEKKMQTKLLITATILPDVNYNDNIIEDKNAKISFEESIKYIYISKDDKKIECEFYFENVGNDDLKIYDVYMNHGCSVGDFSEIVSPGEKGHIIIDCDDINDGKNYKKIINVISNDPVKPQQELRIMYQFVEDDVK
ncbi:MAG: DUF1573 domain-containing protein [Candidatus Cloacimonetes bacterium]|nr:DUF1573 domain-containing protein [Candidatus Cloacimonadota bacterium]